MVVTRANVLASLLLPVCWIDLGSPDPTRAAGFYAELFGWTYGDPDPAGYQVARLAGRDVSGLGPAEDPGPPYWTVVLAVEDIDAAARTARAAGARIVVPPAPAGDLGHAAVAIDPVGAPISLWQPGTHAGMQVRGEPGTFTAIELFTSRPEEAIAFYTNVFGQADRSPSGLRAHFLRAAPPASTPQPSLWVAHVAVDDVPAAARTATRLGAVPEPPPHSTATVLRDPDGALFGLVGIE